MVKRGDLNTKLAWYKSFLTLINLMDQENLITDFGRQVWYWKAKDFTSLKGSKNLEDNSIISIGVISLHENI